MFKKEYVSLVDGIVIEDANSDYKTGKTVGKYKITSNGIYRPDKKYLPKSAVTDIVQDKGSTHVTGCCIGVVPVDRLILKANDMPFVFDFDSEKQVDKAREILGL